MPTLVSGPDVHLARYRETGDPAAFAALFDATSPGLFRLALSLAPDPAAAEDALQDTYLAALEAARRPEPVRDAMAWLVGILKHKVHHVRDRVRRLPDPLRLEPRILESDPSTEAARAEEIERVRRALDALPEPYREAAILRWKYGVEPAAIADARGVPPGTVRSLLSRAAAKLRTALGALFVSHIDTLPARGPDAVREAVLRAARAAAPSKAAAAAAIIGGLLVAKKTVAAVAAVLLLLLGSAWISGRGDGDRDLAPAGGVPPAGHDVTRTAAAPAPQEATAPSAPAIATESPPPASKSPGKAASGSVLVTARWPDGSPAEGIGVVLRLESDREDPRSARVARSGVDGTVLFEDLPPGTAWVRADRDSNGGSRVAIAGGTRPVPFALTLAEGMTVDGVVVDPDNRPVPGATLWLGAGGPLVSGTPAAESGADGKFRLRGVVSPCEIGARAAGYAPSLRALPQGAPGSTQFLVLTLRGPGASVSGRVIDPRGEVVAGALVKVGADGNELELGPQGVEGAQVLGLVVTTDEAGRFRTEGIRPGSVPVRAVVPGFAPWRGEVRVEPQGSADMEIRLGRGATLEGRVLDGEGNPVGKATVSVTDVTGGFHTWALTGSDGAYRIPDVPAGEWLVEAMRIHVGKMRTRMRFEGGKSVTWEPRLSTGRILEGRLVDATGTPLAGWSVTATTEVVAGTVEEYYAMGGSTGTDGRFRFESLPERAMRLLVVAPATDRRVRAPALDLRNLAAGEEPLEIRVPADRLPTSFIEARLAGSDGRVPHDWNVGVDWGAGSTGVAFPDPATGRLKIGPLPPGEYSVHLWSQGRKPLPVRKFRLETGRTEDLGEIVVDPIR